MDRQIKIKAKCSSRKNNCDYNCYKINCIIKCLEWNSGKYFEKTYYLTSSLNIIIVMNNIIFQQNIDNST